MVTGVGREEWNIAFAVPPLLGVWVVMSVWMGGRVEGEGEVDVRSCSTIMTLCTLFISIDVSENEMIDFFWLLDVVF